MTHKIYIQKRQTRKTLRMIQLEIPKYIYICNILISNLGKDRVLNIHIYITTVNIINLNISHIILKMPFV